MVARRHIPNKQRVELFLAHNRVCHICGNQIDGIRERWDVEHIIPLALGGDDEPSNWAPAHVACHREKTKQDATDIGRARRIHARHIGAQAPSRTPLPCGRRSKWKKKISGEVVPRRHDHG